MSLPIRWIAVGLFGLTLAGCDQRMPLEPDQPSALLPARSADSRGLSLMRFPGDFPGVPAYARIDFLPPHVPVIDGWAVVVFYREPSCVRQDFNLLDFFDVPAAFGCPGVVEGFALFEPGVFPGAPKVSHGRGTGALSIWFVPADAFALAVADQILTIAELADLPGLRVGSAFHFTEIHHPQPDPVLGGGHPNPSLTQTARGHLPGGERFQFHLHVQDGSVTSGKLALR